MARLAIVASHPIQYHAHWFRSLHQHPDLDIHIYFCHDATAADQATAGFSVPFSWDIPLTEGYPHTFVTNSARHPSLDRFSGVTAPTLRRYLTPDRHDAVLVLGWQYRCFLDATWYAWRAGLPTMVRGDSNLLVARATHVRMAKALLYRALFARCAACMPVGTQSRQYFLHYGVSPQRLVEVPHSVDPTLFLARAEETRSQRSVLRRSWLIPDNACVALFAGKFLARKRPFDFIRAVASASRQVPPLVGLMVGDGPLRPQCETLVAELEAPIIFTGFLNQEKIVNAYVASDVLVLPSEATETWGLVVDEAMLSGLPALLSETVGSAPDLIQPGETGYTFPVGDIRALTARLVELASNQDSLVRMGHAARARVSGRNRVAVQNVVHAVNIAVKGRAS